MKRDGVRWSSLTIALFLIALAGSVGCLKNTSDDPPPVNGTPTTFVNIVIVNSAGTSGLIVKVDGPGFPSVDKALPASTGGSITDELPGGAGDVLVFHARSSAPGIGVGQCTATATIVGGTVYGQVNVNYDPATGGTVTCSSGWAENPPVAGGTSR